MESLDRILFPLSENHRRALQWFIDHQNTEQPWPSPLGGELHLVTKAKGIFKPSWMEYALSVRQVLNGPYPDRDPIVRSDDTWTYQYYQEGEQPQFRDEIYTNRALMACWRDKIPVGVMRQTHGKPRVRYHVLGVALVAGWDGGYFFFEGFSSAGLSRGKGPQGELDIMLDAESAQTDVFDPRNVIDARQHIISSIVRRQGQRDFRQALLEAYNGRCAISNSDVIEILEAAHIIPYLGPQTNHISNGLLLRADLHILFDLGMIAVDAQKMTVIVSSRLAQTDYVLYDGVRLNLPTERDQWPSEEALAHHRSWAGL